MHLISPHADECCALREQLAAMTRQRDAAISERTIVERDLTTAQAAVEQLRKMLVAARDEIWRLERAK